MPQDVSKTLAALFGIDEARSSERLPSSEDFLAQWVRHVQLDPLAPPEAYFIVEAKGAGKTAQWRWLQATQRSMTERELPRALFPHLVREGDADRIEKVLRHRNSELTLHVERLRSELVAAKRSELIARRDAERLEGQNDAQLSCIGELAKTNRAAQEALIAAKEGRICLHETHFGVVAEREGDEVAVVYERPDGEVEQIYDRTQFVDGKLPEVGDNLEAHVIVASRRAGAVPGSIETGTQGKTDEFSAFREKGVTGPTKI